MEVVASIVIVFLYAVCVMGLIDAVKQISKMDNK